MGWWVARNTWRRGSTRAQALAIGDPLVGQDASKLSLHMPPRKNSTGKRAPVDMFTPLAERLAATRGPGRPDYLLLLAVAALLVFGLVMVFSASQYAVPGDPSYWFRRQALWSGLGVVALLVASRVDYHYWRQLASPGMLLTLLLLLLVLKAGDNVDGGQRWLRLGFFSLQPSELAKLAFTIYTADWLVRKGDEIRSWLYGLLPFAVLTGTVLALVLLLQNDLGTTIVVAALALALFFAAGANPLQLVPTLAVDALGALALVFSSGFRRARIEAFLHPLTPGCTDAVSYHTCQGLISLGSGGLLGRGLGDSLQKAGDLPNPFTDSVFAVIGEELGFIGCVTLLVLFALLAARGYRAGRLAPDAYGALLVCGITTWLLVQALVKANYWGEVTGGVRPSGARVRVQWWSLSHP